MPQQPVVSTRISLIGRIHLTKAMEHTGRVDPSCMEKGLCFQRRSAWYQGETGVSAIAGALHVTLDQVTR